MIKLQRFVTASRRAFEKYPNKYLVALIWGMV